MGQRSPLLWLVGYNYLYNKDFRDSDYDKIGISLDNWDELTGNSWSRSDWTNCSDYVTVHSGPVGSGHGHLDLGHFNFVYKGIPVYIDSGRYTYMTNPIRKHLKSVCAHNTLLLDNEPFSYPKDSWTYYKTAEPLSFYACSHNHTHITELSYIARLSDGMFYMVRRRVIFIKVLSSVVISDFVMSEGTHHVTRLFHVAPDVKAELETSDCCQLKTSYGNLKQHFFSDTNLIVNTSFVSPVYNKLRNTKVIQADNSFKDEGSFLTVIAPSDVKVFKDEVSQSGTYEKINSLFMDALVLKNGEFTKTVLQSQKDTVHGHKLYFYEKVPFYGRLNIMDSDGTIDRFL